MRMVNRHVVPGVQTHRGGAVVYNSVVLKDHVLGPEPLSPATLHTSFGENEEQLREAALLGPAEVRLG